jgi:hypothetical protein
MSHDRGCPCGKEFYEYEECKDRTCPKKKRDCNVVADGVDRHRGEYWYKCLTCGRTDWCAYYDKFEKNEPLKDCKGKHTVKVNRGISLNEEKRYVRVLNDGTAHVLTLSELKNVPESVRLYELGPEVKVKTTIEVVPSKPVYRSGPTSKRTEI